MRPLPSRVANRLRNSLKKFQPILESAKTRDVNESDTVTIVVDMLSQVFGYDKYTEITSEFAIRGTLCDIAIKIEGDLQTLIEVKAIGTELKDQHTRQAVDYAVNQGTEWVVLTNGAEWRIYSVLFNKPVEQELVVNFDLLNLSAKEDDDLEPLFLLAKEGWAKSALGEYRAQREALNRFYLAALIQGDPIVKLIRRQLRQLSPDVKITLEEIRAVLRQEVLKRDVTEGEKAESADKKVSKAMNKHRRAKAAAAAASTDPAAPEPATVQTSIEETKGPRSQVADSKGTDSPLPKE